jgi:hypothetical protein
MNSIKEKNGKFDSEWNGIDKSKANVKERLIKKPKEKPQENKLKFWNNVDSKRE